MFFAVLVTVIAAKRRNPVNAPESESKTKPMDPVAVENPQEKSEEKPKNKPDLSAHKPDKNAVIKTRTQESDSDGNYSNSFESSNGISSNEGGVGGQIVQGSTTWIAKNGEPLAISWVADENGYRPMGFVSDRFFIIFFSFMFYDLTKTNILQHLPTPPPIPLAIQRALKHLATKKPDANDY